MERIGVIGGGTMGAGIAEVWARAGAAAVVVVVVVVVESAADAAEVAHGRLLKSLDRAVRGGRLSEGDSAAATILASNTSSIPLVEMATMTGRAERVVGVHFVNPAPVLPLVEIVASLLTSDETLATVTAFAEDRLGRTTIRSQDRAGFIVNALLIHYILSAIRMMGRASPAPRTSTPEWVQGCAHPQGPLALADPIGLDHRRRRAVDGPGVHGAAVRPNAPAAADGRRGAAGQQDRPRVLTLQPLTSQGGGG